VSLKYTEFIVSVTTELSAADMDPPIASQCRQRYQMRQKQLATVAMFPRWNTSVLAVRFDANTNEAVIATARCVIVCDI